MTAPSIRTTPITRARPAWGSIAQDQAAAAGAQLALLALLSAAVGMGAAGWLAGAAYAGGLWALLAAAARRAGARSLGPADRVTLARAVLVGGVAALVTGHPAGGAPLVTLTTLATVALILDAVDGRVARLTRTVSPLGARFDMEVDAFLILVLSVHLVTPLGPWVLAIGAMRYAFVAAAQLMPWLGRALPPSLARKTVAALQGTVLVAAGSGVVTRPVAVFSAATALALLVWSFGRDVAWLWRTRRVPVGAG